MKDLGPATYFLGLEIDRSVSGFFVSQRKYVLDMIDEFGMQSATPLKLPMDPHVKLTLKKGNFLHDPQPYQHLMGKFIYLTLTRPDLSYPVHNLAQFMHKPTTFHMQAAERILPIFSQIQQVYYWLLLLQPHLLHSMIAIGRVVPLAENQPLVTVFYWVHHQFCGKQ